MAARERPAPQDGCHGVDAEAALATNLENVSGQDFEQLAQFGIAEQTKITFLNGNWLIDVSHVTENLVGPALEEYDKLQWP